MAKSSMIVNMKDGVILNPRAVKTFFAALPDGKNLIESDNSTKRTLPQNRYLHGVLIPEFRKALNSVGYDEVKNDSQAKLILKTMFLTRSTTNKETGQILEFVEDTHNLTTVELNTLIDEVIKFCAEHMSYQIAYPNEQMMLSYE
jgi:hypothetical protein